MVFWKGNEEGKEKLEVKGGQGGLLPIFNYVSRPGPHVSPQSGAAARTIACAVGV